MWFRYKSRMTVRVKANRTSEYSNNMGCRHCNTNEIESQEYLENCEGIKTLKGILNMSNPREHITFWRGDGGKETKPKARRAERWKIRCGSATSFKGKTQAAVVLGTPGICDNSSPDCRLKNNKNIDIKKSINI